MSTRNGDKSIEVSGLVKTFGDQRALDGVDFEVSAGEVFGLLGPNGAGKTTLVNVLATLAVPDGGFATVCGHDVVRDSESVRASIALTGQFAAVDEVLTGRENLVLFGRLRGLDRQGALERAEALLAQFSLTDAATKAVGKYSGGMRRRLDLAASLVVPPRVLFLDEPTTGLDPRSRSELWEVVRELRSEGLTIVLTTQYLEEADQLADRIAVIDHGRIVASGTADELKAEVGGRSCVVKPTERKDLDALSVALSAVGATTVDEELVTVTLAEVGADRLGDVVDAAKAAGIELADLLLRRPTLDEVFMHLTGSPTDAGASGDGEPAEESLSVAAEGAA